MSALAVEPRLTAAQWAAYHRDPTKPHPDLIDFVKQVAWMNLDEMKDLGVE